MKLICRYWVLGLLLAACSAPAAPPANQAAPAGPAGPAATVAPAATSAAAQPAVARLAPLSPPLAVKMAETPGSSNAGVYIALARGYFRDEGLDVTLET